MHVTKKNFTILLTGSLASQAIAFAGQLALAYLYAPKAFGEYVTYLAVLNIIACIGAMRYDSAIIASKTESDATYLVIVSLFISIVFCVVFLLVNFIVGDLISGVLKISKSVVYLSIMSAFLVILSQSIIEHANRTANYKSISFSQIIQSIVVAISGISLGSRNIEDGIIYSHITGIVCLNLFLMYDYIWKIFKSFESTHFMAVCSNAIVVFKEYRQFPLYTLPQSVVAQFGNQSVPIIMQALYTPVLLGQYYLAYKLIVAPITIVCSNLSKIYSAEAVNLYESDGRYLFELTRRRLAKLFLFSLAVGCLAWCITPYIYKIFFDIKWENSGVITRILIPYLIIDFVVTPFSRIFLIAGKNANYFIWDFARAIALMGIGYLCWFIELNYFQFLVTYSFAMMLFSLYLFMVLLNKKSFLWVKSHYE